MPTRTCGAGRVRKQVRRHPWSIWQRVTKRSLDVAISSLGLAVTAPLILWAAWIAGRETGLPGFFRQTRLGRNGRTFEMLKIRSMREGHFPETNVTTADDPRITRWGRFFRRSKIDELPQLWNVLMGDMSLVGPRPDVPEIFDHVRPADRQLVLSVRPGLTGPATIRYRDEEELLAMQDDPEFFNERVIFPEKIRMNREYIQTQSFVGDLLCLYQTVMGTSRRSSAPSHAEERQAA